MSHHSINIWKNLLDTSWDNNAVVTLIMALAPCSVHGTLMSSASSAGGGWNGNVSVVSSPCPKATSQEQAKGADRRLEDIPLHTPFRKTCEEVALCEVQLVETQEQYGVEGVLFLARRLRVNVCGTTLGGEGGRSLYGRRIESEHQILKKGSRHPWSTRTKVPIVGARRPVPPSRSKNDKR